MKRKNHLFKSKRKIISIVVISTFFMQQSGLAATLTFSQVPLFLTSNAVPNVLVMYGNSNSMDEDATGQAVGSANSNSKSEIARAAIKNLVSSYQGKINLGLMAYAQNNISLNDLYNGPYDPSYNPANYNPNFTGDRTSTTKKFEMPNPTSSGSYIYYNVALPSYLNSGSHTSTPNYFCFTTSSRAKAFSNGEVIANNNISDSNSGPWLTYNCYSKKTGTKDITAGNTNATTNGYSGSLSSLSGEFFPTDSDLAQGITNFGYQIAGVYVSPTWFSNTSPGYGYVHVPIASLTSAQATKINTKLGTSQFSTNAPTNASYPLQNAGLSPIAGSVNTAASYFGGTLTSSTQGGPLSAPPNSCGKNYMVMLTDGLPSVLSSGQISYTTATLLSDLTTTVSNLNTKQSVTSYIVGFALPYGVNASQLNSIATAGGSGAPYYATDPASLNAALGNVFSNIISRSGASAAVALNSGYVSLGNQVYQARFNSADWSGDLLSVPLTSSGTLPTDLINNATWRAAVTIGNQTATNRVIITEKASTGTGIPYRWPVNQASPTTNEMDVAQTTPLNINPNSSTSDGLGASRLAFLRGDRTLEGTTFRTRSTVLGDIINSSPVLVGPPSATMVDSTYLAFKTAQASRPTIVYVGSNDGMLHGFNATTGAEVLAYVPNEPMANLNQLTSPSYAHMYFVDGSPNEGDVYYNNAWHSVLVSSFGAGGRGIFSLDVTNPGSFSEANASQIFKFEFTEAQDTDVGYIMEKPSIVQLNNGKWAAIFGNGYNSTGTGTATLFIVDIQTGALIKKISTANGSTSSINGLSNPAVIDADGNGTADYVYAGDLNGNMWKFDLTSTNPANWGVAYSGKPLFSAGQPITETPDVSPNPNGGYMVEFGTGKYLEVADNTTTPQNAFYGLWDNGTSVITGTSQLQQQTVTSTITGSSTSYRVVSSNTVNYATQRGWYLTFPVLGERSVTDSVITGGKVIFSTLVPSSTSCSYGGTSWLMELDYLNGYQSPTPVFDTNGDGVINSNDTATAGMSLTGIASAPTLLQGLGTSTSPLDEIFFNQSNGSIANVYTTGSSLTSRRTAWKEIITQ